MNTDLIKRLREAQVNGEASIYGECADALEAQQPTGDAADVVEELLYLKRNYLKRYSNKTQAIVSKATALIQQQARQAIADELEERSLRGQVATLTERCEGYDKVLEKCAELNGWGASTHALTERQRLQEQTDESG
jgi:hypothetical protein